MKGIQMNGARTRNSQLPEWIRETAELCQPDEIHICDGSEKENQKLCNDMVKSGRLFLS